MEKKYNLMKGEGKDMILAVGYLEDFSTCDAAPCDGSFAAIHEG